ncbi:MULTISPECIES: amino acid ABC transporter permease [Gluconobacter]|uniref:Amino acid ABC transporter permease n=1 Tax=Gluconobacter cadivus TaxID=2728101 RepID=A0ABR9YU82_9PROT|nr:MULTISPECIES: amino acid ABC transporter permease [Gluconobacter]MBF0887808.1 amino acid ABC transporter permease [Gluconobacter cadivus]MBS1059675.1 amino acid ABC transporter permease [Gluconobacter sp. Dm-44]
MIAFSHYDITLLLQAMVRTVVLSLGGGILGIAGAIILTALRLSEIRVMIPLRVLAVVYVQTIRRIPFIVTLYIVFFCTGMMGVDVSATVVAIGSIGLIAAAYLCEILHGGVKTVPVEQVEAALVLNLPLWARWRHVIGPQAMSAVVPPAVGYLVLFIKDTALASQIGVVELSQAGVILTNRGLPSTQVFCVVLLLYFAISYPLTCLSRLLEKRIAVH